MLTRRRFLQGMASLTVLGSQLGTIAPDQVLQKRRAGLGLADVQDDLRQLLGQRVARP